MKGSPGRVRPGGVVAMQGLSAEEALIDAYAAHVLGLGERTYGALPRTPRDLPLARILAFDSNKERMPRAYVPGNYVEWLLGRKRGFSRAEAYFGAMTRAYRGALGATPEIWVWRFDAPLPDELLGKLELRCEAPLGRLGPADRAPLVSALWALVLKAEGPLDHWLLDAWALLAAGDFLATGAPRSAPKVDGVAPSF